jgi:hypothetical protein
VFNDGTSATYVSALTPTIVGNAGTRNGTALTLGDNDGGGFLNGKIAEVVVFNSVLTTPQIAELFAYFSARYGISVGP